MNKLTQLVDTVSSASPWVFAIIILVTIAANIMFWRSRRKLKQKMLKENVKTRERTRMRQSIKLGEYLGSREIEAPPSEDDRV